MDTSGQEELIRESIEQLYNGWYSGKSTSPLC